jgi:hypothetical protein
MAPRTRRRTLSIAAAAALLAGVVFQSAPTPGVRAVSRPPNDAWTDAIQLEGFRGSVHGTTVGATSDHCQLGYSMDHTVWYRFRVPYSGVLRSIVESEVDLSWTTSRYDSPCPYDRRSQGSGQSALAYVKQGDVWYFAIGGQYMGNFTLHWGLTRPPPPPNDDFANALAIFGIYGSTRVWNAHGTRQLHEPHHAGKPGGRSVWFKWRSPVTRGVYFNTILTYLERRTVLAVYRGSTLQDLSRVAADDGSGRRWARVHFGAHKDVVYRIAVDTPDGAETSVVECARPPCGIWLTWKAGGPPANDDFPNARLLDPAGGRIPIYEVGATSEPGEPIHVPKPVASSVHSSQWFRYVAPRTGYAHFDVSWIDATVNSPQMAVYTGSSLANLTRQRPDDHGFYVRRGRTYWIALDTQHDQPGTGNFAWSGPLANDAFADAERLLQNAGFGAANLFEASAEPGEPPFDPFSDRRVTVWYRWTPSDSGYGFVMIHTSATVEVFEGTSLDLLDERPVTDWGNQLLTFPVVAGTSYAIRIRSSPSSYSFTWGVGAANPPVDDEPPTVAVTEPSAGSEHAGIIRFAADAADDSGAVRVTIHTYNTGVVDASPPYEGGIPGLEGPQVAWATAEDPWGNETETGWVPYTANNFPPWTAGGVPRLVENDRRRVFWEWEVAADARTQCSIDSAAFEPCTSPLVIGGLSPGYHWFRIRASDRFDTSSTPITTLLRVNQSR